MADFMSKLEDEMNVSFAENGAKGFATTKHYLLDMNFDIPRMRTMTEAQITANFIQAFRQTPELALKWMFFARDVRGGLGERRLFRILLKYIANEEPFIMEDLIKLIPEYGRWDDVFELISKDVPSNVKDKAIKVILSQLKQDIFNYSAKKPYSLLAKWMPSINGKDKQLAAYLASYIGYNYKRYRKMLSTLRKGLKIVEVDMSANNWGNINYESVPSRANLIYASSFLAHDFTRRQEYLNAVKQGNAKINASVLYPHDVLHKYPASDWQTIVKDDAVEALWKNLPNYVGEDNSTLVVCDGSGSMCMPIGAGGIQAVEVSRALAIYFAEKLTGPYANKFITFSSNPQLVDLSGCQSLAEKYEVTKKYDDYTNTDIEKVFDLILKVAQRNNLKQEELPKNVLIISDMEFDRASRYDLNETLFEVISKKFESCGYKLPRLVFWNVNSRTHTVPITQNKLGVALVSGFSPVIAKMILSGELDPWKVLVEALNVLRYDKIGEIYQKNKLPF